MTETAHEDQDATPEEEPTITPEKEPTPEPAITPEIKKTAKRSPKAKTTSQAPSGPPMCTLTITDY